MLAGHALIDYTTTFEREKMDRDGYAWGAS